MLLAEEEERLKNNLLTPSNIVASEETSNCLANTRGTRTASNQDKVVKLLSDTGCIKTSPKEYAMGLVLTGESIFLHEEIKKIFKEEKQKMNQISKRFQDCFGKSNIMPMYTKGKSIGSLISKPK